MTPEKDERRDSPESITETGEANPASRRKPPRSWRNLSMVSKMTILMSALIMLACVAGGVLSYAASSKAIEKEIHFAGSQVVTSISSAISTEMLNLPLDDKRQEALTNIQAVLSKLLSSDKEGRIEDAFILDKVKEDKDGKKSYSILAAKTEARVGGNFEFPDLLNDLANLRQFTNTEKISVVASPVKFGKNHVGYVVITFNQKSLIKARNSIFVSFLLVFLSAFAITVLVTRFAIKYQLRPVVKLGKVAQEFADGNYDFHIEEVPGRDEIATATNSFAKMRRTVNTLVRFSNRALVEKIRSGEISEEMEDANLSIVFFDGVGSTEWAARYTARQIGSMLTEYFTLIGIPIRKMGGIIDKYMGDGAMIVFGIKDDEARNYSRNAIQTMFCIQHVIAFANYAFHTFHHRNPLKFRFGAASGRCVVGAMGDKGEKAQMSWTSLGMAVNIASKLEKVCQESGILLDRFTYKNCGGEDYLTAEGPKGVKVKSVKKTIKTYTMTSYKEDADNQAVRKIILDCLLSDEVKAILNLKDEDYDKFVEFVKSKLDDDKEPLTMPAPDYVGPVE